LTYPNTFYKIQIWASNEIGDGAKTELTIKTKSDMTEIGKLLFYLFVLLIFYKKNKLKIILFYCLIKNIFNFIAKYYLITNLSVIAIIDIILLSTY